MKVHGQMGEGRIMEDLSRRTFISTAAAALGLLGLTACSQAQTETAPKDAETPEDSTAQEASTAASDIQPLDAPLFMEIDKNVWHICEYGFDSIFVVIGNDRAAVIDTGTGVCDLPAIIAQITDKPYDVYLTHGHVDHAGGMHQFERVYLHEADFDAARSLNRDERINYMNIMLSMCGGIYAVDESSIVEDKYDTELLPLKEGDIIDLGGRQLEVFETPGHTPGALSILDRTSEIMFTGDSCNQNTLVARGGAPALMEEENERNTLGALLESAKKLRDLRDAGEFSRNYNGHVGYARWLTFTPQRPAVIDDCITLCEGVMDGSIEPTEQPSFDGSSTVLVASTDNITIQFEEWQIG